MDRHLQKSFLAAIPLQQLKASDLKRHYTDLMIGPATKAQHHAIVHSASKAAVLDGLVTRNVASLVVGKPKAERTHADIIGQCWTAEEAREFLKAVKAAGPQPAALFTLAIETGMRKSERCGLKWADVYLPAGKLRVVRQLLSPGPEITFGVPKNAGLHR